MKQCVNIPLCGCLHALLDRKHIIAQVQNGFVVTVLLKTCCPFVFLKNNAVVIIHFCFFFFPNEMQACVYE